MSGNNKRYNTRSSSNVDAGLSHDVKDTLDQVTDEVQRVCSVNEGTGKKIDSLMAYLDKAQIQVCFAIV
jgi:hypothetical protein